MDESIKEMTFLVLETDVDGQTGDRTVRKVGVVRKEPQTTPKHRILVQFSNADQTLVEDEIVTIIPIWD